MSSIRKHLYFVCPTDSLETVISSCSKEENFYLSSLGNSIAFTEDMIAEINALVETNTISEITFVLSADNRIVKEALEGYKATWLSGLGDFHLEITAQQKKAPFTRQSEYLTAATLSNYLSARAKELEAKLSSYLTERTVINVRIYGRYRNAFCAFSGDLFRQESCRLN